MTHLPNAAGAIKTSVKVQLSLLKQKLLTATFLDSFILSDEVAVTSENFIQKVLFSVDLVVLAHHFRVVFNNFFVFVL